MSNSNDISKMIGEAEKEFEADSGVVGVSKKEEPGYKGNIDSETLKAKARKEEIDQFANNAESDALLAMVAQSGGMPDTDRSRSKSVGRTANSAAEFRSFDAESIPPQSSSLDFVHEIPVQLTVELGRTKIPIKNILQLAQGSVVELDGLAGEPMDVLVNGFLIASGEVVVVNDRFGIRLTDVLSPTERLKKMSSSR